MAGMLNGTRSSRLTRFSIGLLIFILLVVTTTLLLRPLQIKLDAQIREVRDWFIGQAETFLGMRIEYTSMGPSIFGSLDIRDLRFYRTDPEASVGTGDSPPAALLQIHRLRLSYSFLRLIRGEVVDSFEGIRLDKPRLTLYPGDLDWIGRVLPVTESPGIEDLRQYLRQLPRAFTVRIRDGSSLIVTGEDQFRIGNLALESSILAGRISIRGKAGAGLTLNSLPEPFRSLTMTGWIGGSFSDDLEDGTLNIRIPTLAGDAFALRTLAFTLDLGQENLELRKIQDAVPWDLAVVYAYDSGLLSGEFRAEGFSLRQMLVSSGRNSTWLRLFGLAVSGDLSFALGKAGDLRYNVDLSGDFSPIRVVERIGYTLSLHGDRETLNCRRFLLYFPQGTISYTGELGLDPLAPNGTITVSDFSLTGDGVVNADFFLNTTGRNISLFTENLSLGPVFLSALDIEILLEETGFTFLLTALRFTGMESYEDVRLSHLTIDGSYDEEPRHLQVSLVLDVFEAMDLLDMVQPFIEIPEFSLPLNKVIEDISITTELFVTTDFKQILYNAPRSVITYEGSREIFALVSVSGTDRNLEINEYRIVWADSEVDGGGYTDFSDPNDVSFSFRTTYQGLAYHLEGVVQDYRSISVYGSYDLSANFGVTEGGGYSGYIEALSIPVPSTGQLIFLTLRSSLRYNSPDSWFLNIEQMELVNLVTPTSPMTTLRIAGRVDQDGMLFQELFFDDGRGILSGSGTAVRDRESSRIDGQIILTNMDGTERYNITGTYDGDQVDVSLSGTGMQVSRVLRDVHNAVATADARLIWNSWDSYSLRLNYGSFFAQFGERELRVTATGSLDEEECTIEAQVSYDNFQVELPLFRVNRREAHAKTMASIRGSALGRDIDLSFSGDASFQPIDSWFDIDRILKEFRGRIQVDRIQFASLESDDPFQVEFSRTGSSISLEGGPNNMIRLSLADDGAFYTGLSYPSPIRGSITGSITQRIIDAESSNLYIDLESLWRIVPAQDIVNCTGGFVTGSVTIRGPLGDPEFFGAVQGISVRLMVPRYLTEEIGPTPIDVILDGNEMRFGPVRTPVGNGFGEVSGWFRFDRWVPNTFTLDIRVAEDDSIPFGLDIMGVLAKGIVSGHLNLSMEDTILRINGNLTGQNTEITLDTQEISTGVYRYPPADNVSVITNISITTGTKVEFLWPTADFPLLRAYAEVGSRIRIISDTVTDRFTVTGDVNLRNGEIFYFQRSFYVRQGVLSFNENEIQFDPRLTVRAEIRDHTEDGPVTISMFVDNAPLKSFTARLESNPPLSQFEILSLLGQNVTSTTAESGSDSIVFLNSAADIFAQIGVIRRIERRIRDFIGLDMFSVRTQVLQNALMQFTGWRNPVDRIGRVGNYFDNTTVFLGKYFGSNMFAQFMLSTHYNENKIDWWGIEFEGDLGIEMHSPLFDIRWNIVPLHFENMFVDDITFTILWRKSF
jgi:hypothetical protein